MRDRQELIANLVYHLTAGLRHATQLEIMAGHGIDTLPTKAMLAQDIGNARVALAKLENLVKEKLHG